MKILLSILLLCVGFGLQAQSSKELQLGFRVIPMGEETFLGASVSYFQGISSKISVGIRADVTTDALEKEEEKYDYDYSDHILSNLDAVMRISLSKKAKRFQWFAETGLSGMKVVEEIFPQHFVYCGNFTAYEQEQFDYLLTHSTYKIDHLFGVFLGVSMEIRLGTHGRVGLGLPVYFYHSTLWNTLSYHANPTL